jgi:SLT domain-containing protein
MASLAIVHTFALLRFCGWKEQQLGRGTGQMGYQRGRRLRSHQFSEVGQGERVSTVPFSPPSRKPRLDAVPQRSAPDRERTVTSAWEAELVRVIELDPHAVGQSRHGLARVVSQMVPLYIGNCLAAIICPRQGRASQK